MKFSAARKALMQALMRCKGVADKKSTMPILGNVLVETASASEVRFAATDLYLAVTTRVDARIEKPGGIAVEALGLLERVKNMPDGEVTLETKGAQLTIKAAGSKRRFTMAGIEADEYPTLPEPEDGARATKVSAATLLELVSRIDYAISDDITRLHLNSGLLEWEESTLRMVATDGHRLSKAEHTCDHPMGAYHMLLPKKGVAELRRLCEAAADLEGDDAVSLVNGGPDAFFAHGGVRLSVKLVDAQFPPYQQVVPERSAVVLKVPRAALMEAVRSVAVAASHRTGGVKFTIADGKMSIEGESPEHGAGFDELAADYVGPPVSLGLNALYLLQALGCTEAEEMSLEFSGELDPVVLRGENYLAVVMPMRI